jgi:hypothetical protein
MRLVSLFTAAAFSLAALTGTTGAAFAQATPMTDGKMESAGKEKKAAKPAKRAKKGAKKSSQ